MSNTKTPIKNIIFDVDGTLWDSAEAVALSWNDVLDAHYRDLTDRVVTADDMYRLMGHTMDVIGKDLYPNLPKEKRDEIMIRSMEHENRYLEDHPGRFYEGLEETMKALTKSGHKLYIVSNCQDGYIEALLRHGSYHLYITDYECFGRTGKPKWDSIRILMERNQLEDAETVYLGDTHMDEEATEKAGLRFLHAAYGFGTANHPAAIVNDIHDLPAVLETL